MKKFAFITDTHFNFFSKEEIAEKAIHVKNLNLDGIFLTGDISNYKNIVEHLNFIENIINIPIYFTTGNHDAWQGSIKSLRQKLSLITNKNLVYLDNCPPIELAENVSLVGTMGWYDGRWANPLSNFVFFPDWLMIKEFHEVWTNEDRLDICQELAHEQSDNIYPKLIQAFKKSDTVYFLTHFPPWPEACPSFKSLTERFWIPFNTSKYMSEMIEALMKDLPNKKLIVLTGHTHYRKNIQLKENIEVRVGGAGRNKDFSFEMIIL